MVGNLDAFSAPEKAFERANRLGIKLVQSDKSKAHEILAFESEHFPKWEEYFRSALSGQSSEEILLAVKNDGEIVGSALIG